MAEDVHEELSKLKKRADHFEEVAQAIAKAVADLGNMQYAIIDAAIFSEGAPPLDPKRVAALEGASDKFMSSINELEEKLSEEVADG